MDPAKKKNRKKKIRIGIQIVLLLFLGIFIYERFYKGSYQENDALRKTNKFIALSYVGVEKYNSGSTTRISQERLNEHMAALKAMGYETISQEDVINLYEKGDLVPEQSLFLMFEDGRKDTGVFAHELLKEHNYIATMMTYGEKFEEKDNRFLSGKDMLTLLDTSYWEHGSNGYRLEYINVFDEEKEFQGVLTADEFNTISHTLERDYDHYLMDYIRDEDRIATETYEEMATRISEDYSKEKEVYEEQMDALPEFYTIMHSNTGQFGTNTHASEINEGEIRSRYRIHMNREGYALNTEDTSPYDLTRMQPQANWYANHLIMRITDDTGEEPVFVVGDEKEAGTWNISTGAAEFRNNSIVVTSPSNDMGSIWREVDMIDSTITLVLEGNQGGVQNIHLASLTNVWEKVEISLDYNSISINDITGSQKGTLFTYDLQELDGVEEEGIIGLNDRGYRKLEIQLKDNYISLMVDDEVLIKNLDLGRTILYNQLTLAVLPLSENQEQYSQRNLVDDVYDGVFTNIIITKDTTSTVTYSYILDGWDKISSWITKWYQLITTKIMEIF